MRKLLLMALMGSLGWAGCDGARSKPNSVNNLEPEPPPSTPTVPSTPSDPPPTPPTTPPTPPTPVEPPEPPEPPPEEPPEPPEVTLDECGLTTDPPSSNAKLALPPDGKMYHGARPAGSGSPDSDISMQNLADYEATVGRRSAYVYLSNNWFQSRKFPMRTAKMLRDKGSIPFIRLMMRSHQFSLQPDEYFTLRRIISGEFDCDLKAWADAAVEFGTPLIVEYGTEVNGDWFPWSAPYNLEPGETMDKDAGPAKVPGLFKSAFRHIVELMRERGAHNITWAFHIYSENYPQNRYWNHPKNYYPGDDVVDWIGISAYASEKPCDYRCPSFESLMTNTLAMLAEATTTKPFFLFELGVTDNNPGCDARAWLSTAMNDLLSGRWPIVKGFAWWNENWMNGRPASCTAPSDETVMMVQKSTILGSTLRQTLADGPLAGKLVDRPMY